MFLERHLCCGNCVAWKSISELLYSIGLAAATTAFLGGQTRRDNFVVRRQLRCSGVVLWTCDFFRVSSSFAATTVFLVGQTRKDSFAVRRQLRYWGIKLYTCGFFRLKLQLRWIKLWTTVFFTQWPYMLPQQQQPFFGRCFFPLHFFPTTRMNCKINKIACM